MGRDPGELPNRLGGQEIPYAFPYILAVYQSNSSHFVQLQFPIISWLTSRTSPYSSPPDGVMTWKSFGAAVPDSRQACSSQIEMASYVLLALCKRGSVLEGLELMKWLSRQRTHLGGFGSTQVTQLSGSLPLFLQLSSYRAKPRYAVGYL